MTESSAKKRPMKELRERFLACLLLVFASPILLGCAVAIKLEALTRSQAKGPVFFREVRMARGRSFLLLKFRTLTSDALEGLGDGPTHIALLEQAGSMTLSGRFVKQWYLDELPQLINVARGEMGLIGTRPWPVELYEDEVARGITRKRDMPSGLIGPVQASKGTKANGLELDLGYWELYKYASGWKLLKTDVMILLRSLGVLAKHEGI